MHIWFKQYDFISKWNRIGKQTKKQNALQSQENKKSFTLAKDNGTQKQGNQSCQEIHLRLLGKMYSQIEFIGESWRIAESIAKL